MVHQAILDIPQLCYQAGVRQFVISPGSRSAPLTLAVARHAGLSTIVVADERSAAFIALGMSQASGKPVGLVCTSGTAGLNYAPAIAEAFFLQVPLLVFTADRPPEWIGQLDGQTIHQQNLYGKHCKAWYQLPDSYNHPDQVWQIHRQVNEALVLCAESPAGPVHLNVPFREPFYPQVGEPWNYRNLPPYQSWNGQKELPEAYWQILASEWQQFSRKLVVAGQARKNKGLAKDISQLCRIEKIPLLADLLSNLHSLDGAIRHHDSFLLNKSHWQNLQPDLLLTFGKSVISKSVKQFLRSDKVAAHWHIQESGPVADPFQSITRVIRMAPEHFFKQLVNRPIRSVGNRQQEYSKTWHSLEATAQQLIRNWIQLDTNWCEMAVVYYLTKNIPAKASLHMANSSAVRYAGWLGLPSAAKGVELLANRGTSGIDGCTSTALGFALNSKVPAYLVTGDVAFLYDRNAFWGHKIPDNLKIILLNNNAGGIFRLINGPAQQPELAEYFETEQPLTAQNLAAEFGLVYYRADHKKNFISALQEFMKLTNAAILEVKSDSEHNAATFSGFQQLWR